MHLFWKHIVVLTSCCCYLLSRVQVFATPWTAARQASLSVTKSRSLVKLMSIESVMPSNCLILCRPLLLLPSVFPSIRVFSNESALCIRWPKYWSLSFSFSPSNEYSVLISFRIGWFGLLAVQGTLNSWDSSSSHSESFELALNMWSLPQSPFGQPNSFYFHPVQYKKLSCLNSRFVYVQSRKWHRWSYLQSRSGDIAAEDNCMDTKEELEWTYIPYWCWV